MKKFIVCRRVSGFGDMLSQLCHAIALSKTTGLPLYVDWRNILYSDKNSPHENFFGKYVYYRDPSVKPVEVLFSEFSGETVDRIKSFDYCSNLNKVQVRDVLEGDSTVNDLGIEGECLLITQPIPCLHKEELYKLLRDVYFSSDMYSEANRVLDLIGEKFIAIHYRHGNGEFSDFKSYSDHFSEIESLLKIYQANIEDLHLPIYISTDSLEADLIFKEVFGSSARLYFSEKLAPPNSGAIHYSSLVNGESGGNMFDVFLSTITDMLVIANAKSIYRDSRSSFSNYSCALASQVEVFSEHHYPTKRRKASRLASHKIIKEARRIVGSRSDRG
ncbi:hypothetical protein [Marinobacter zhanjiangensis]|uniref:Nodulation protein Z n=1 Tax=Marinobacter zhanjiangensis TaxID=578215 RepID=A0ABQ3B5T5_9GAMM|nr:hypothetical protein [Marinobacter zhanjiangensis]GGY76347.1 nodulation protein Z [Marinobacter zhanjiangensis]